MDDKAKKIHWILGQPIVHTIAIGLRQLAEHSFKNVVCRAAPKSGKNGCK